ncbi:MAG TPA: GlsB/YeaQ/YmgE family stress response membrane protein [Nocardioidaceae bacterium]|nr:GlsB/YeaQ/YmgE family stress response membrane protein [Nocardioidaceae bacterium]
MLILAIIVLGLAAGWVAHLLVGRGQPDWGLLFLIGIGGSFVGGLLGSLLFGDGLEIRASGLIGSIVGATILLAAYRAFKERNTRRVSS